MFTGVIWNGAVSQGLLTGGNSPNYWTNVANAFGTASSLVSSVNALPGGTNKVIVAHSLGNMLVSSAINDFGANGLHVSQYFMMDAAMPMEAFDPSTFGNTNLIFTGGMITLKGIPITISNPAWASYSNNLWASYWYSLFPPSDGRYGLTWKNRFSNFTANTNVTKINFWSSGEDVLANGNGTMAANSQNLALESWTYQEMSKGTGLQSALTLLTIKQGGWGMNQSWESFDANGSLVQMPSSKANALTTTNLQTNTFFTPFADGSIITSGGNAEAAKPAVRAQALAEGIPALSFAVGRNAISAAIIPNNYDMTTQLEDGWPASRANVQNQAPTAWLHGDAKDVAYPFTHRLWQKIVNIGLLNKN